MGIFYINLRKYLRYRKCLPKYPGPWYKSLILETESFFGILFGAKTRPISRNFTKMTKSNKNVSISFRFARIRAMDNGC